MYGSCANHIPLDLYLPHSTNMPRKAPVVPASDVPIPVSKPIAKNTKAKKASSKTKVTASLLPPIEDLSTSLKTIIAKCRTEEAMIAVRPLSVVPPFAGLVASELGHITSVISEMDKFWSTVSIMDDYLEADHAIYESDKRQLLVGTYPGCMSLTISL